MRRGPEVSPSQLALIAFKPRQVLILEHQQSNQPLPASMATNKPEIAAQLKPEDESILTCSVALWLENKGFSKVLKRFLPAAQIQDADWKAKAVNLNEIFSQYQEIRNSASAHKDLKSQNKLEPEVNITEKNGDANGAVDGESQGKKKKKRKVDTAVNKTDEGLVMSEKENKSYVYNNKDESQKTSGSSHEDQRTKASNGVLELAEDQSIKNQKEKKKKKSKLTTELLQADAKGIEVLPDGDTTVDTKSKKRSSEADVDGITESKKASKKRKREIQSDQELEVEEPKTNISKGLEDGKDESNKNATNNSMEKSSQQKSANKQAKSSEPKTVNAFQRVKIDEVEFVDERLQDNSYWAKDGAETGYGAKAQEVLGQVKGRGFRHEKTKKKRGSYRGGQIDLQSHSIKFNYSDEE